MNRFVPMVVLASCSLPRTERDVQRDFARSLAPASVSGTTDAGEIPRNRAVIRIYADADYRRRVLQWERQIETVIGRASDITGRDLGLVLAIHDRRAWDRRSSGDDLAACLLELESLDAGEDVDWIVGLVTGLPGATSAVHHLGMARVFGRHLVVRAMDDTVENRALDALDKLSDEERSRLYADRRAHKTLTVLLHELGHTLGALHTRDGEWILSPQYDHRSHGFSPANIELMRLGLERRGETLREPAALRRWQEALSQAVERIAFAGWDPRDRDLVVKSRGTTTSAGSDAAGVALSALDREGFELAVKLVTMGKPTEALATLERLVGRNPDNAQVASLACSVQLAVDRGSRAALEACRRATEVAVADGLPLVGYADTLLLAGTAREVPALLGRAKTLLEGEATPRRDVWRYFSSVCQTASLVTWAVEAAAVAGDTPHQEAVMAWARQTRRRFGLPEEGERYQVVPADEGSVLQELIASSRLFDPAATVRRADLLLKKYPGLPGALWLRCDAHWRAHRWTSARRDCERALTNYPDASLAHLTLGLVLRQTGDAVAAIAHLERAASLDPALDAAWDELERTYAARGDRQRAAEVRRRRVVQRADQAAQPPAPCHR